MSAYLYALIDFVAAHQQWAYALVFFVALSESLPVLGAIIPGSTAIIAISALVPSGAVAILPLLTAAIAGAIAGDGFAFWLGYRYREQIVRLWPLSRHPEMIGIGTSFFERHGAKSVLIARFTPPVRPFVPLAAGMLRMPALRFYAANIISALAWAPAHVLPGVLVGASLSLAGAVAGRLAVLMVLLAVVLWGAVALVRFGIKWGLPRLDVALARLWAWVNASDTRASRMVRPYLDPAQPEFRTLLLLAAILVVAAIVFAAVLESVATESPAMALDVTVNHFLQGLRTAWADRVLIAVTELGDAAVTIPVTVAVLAWLLWRRAWHAAAYWLGAIALAAAMTAFIKFGLRVPRPADLYAGASAFSFPSGHTIVSATVYGFLALLVAREFGARWRAVLTGGIALFVTAIALSRLYLGAHWLSDVIGGFAFALAWVALLGIAYLRHRPPRLGAGALLTVAGLTLVVAGGAHIWRAHAADLNRYAVRADVRTINVADWQNSAWQSLPERRLDLDGEAEEPLTLQWAGDPMELARQLQTAGWREAAPWTLQGVLLWLAPDADPLRLPVLPRLHSGRPPALIMVHADVPGLPSGGRLVMRLWASDVSLRVGKANSRPVWLGEVIEERQRRPLGLLTLVAAQPGADGPRDVLAAALDRPIRGRRTVSPSPVWDGGVILGAAAPAEP